MNDPQKQTRRLAIPGIRDFAPPPPPASIAPVLGLYGQDHPMLDLYERDGVLFADGCGLTDQPVFEAEPGCFVDASGRTLLTLSVRDGQASAVIGGLELVRRDFFAAAVSAFRRAIASDLDRLRAESLVAVPPVTAGSPTPLVAIPAVDPSIVVDMRYASADNFLGKPLYDRGAAYLIPEAAAALSRVQALLQPLGLQLLVLDAYRPWSVTWLFWQAIPSAFRAFVADPACGSKHNRGCAVDLTLARVGEFQSVAMPSDYDEPGPRAAPDYRGSTTYARWHRNLLRAEMERAGFTVDPHEWWHYDFAGWEAHPIRNEPLSALD